MIVVGGLVVFFSVFLELLTQAGVMKWLYLVIEKVLSFGGMPQALSQSIVGGIFEVTLGARYAGESATFIPLSFKVAAAALILSWGGLSVHAQIASILHSTDIRYWPFLLARLVHGIFAACIVLFLWEPIAGGIESQHTLFTIGQSTHIHWTTAYLFLLRVYIIIIIAMIILSAICYLTRSLWLQLRQSHSK
ncbi:Sporulation integral membrane protein YlbJ [compost metagenome]